MLSKIAKSHLKYLLLHLQKQLFICYYIFGRAGSFCCTRAFASWGEAGLLSSWGSDFLLFGFSLQSTGFRVHRLQYLWYTSLVAHGTLDLLGQVLKPFLLH